MVTALLDSPRSGTLSRVKAIIRYWSEPLTSDGQPARRPTAAEAADLAFRTIFEHAAEMMIVIDEAGRIIKANAATVLMTGYPRPELQRMTLADIDQIALSLEELANLKGDEVQVVRGRHRRRNGTLYPVQTSLRRLPSQGPDRFLVSAADITEREQGERLGQMVVDRTLQAQEDERKRIARELHDGLCQAVSSVLMQLDALDTRSLDPRTLATIRSALSDTLVEIRRLSHGLRPAALDEIGLVAAIELIVAQARRAGLDASLACVGVDMDSTLPPDLATALYRIAQEAVNNGMRHARSKQISVVLHATKRKVRMLIEDDGCGFDPDADTNKLGLGLTSMAERARMVRGTFLVERQLGGGTSVVVTAPLETLHA